MPPQFRLPVPAPIMYAEATASEIGHQQTIPLTIDYTQMNNLTRNMNYQGDSSTLYVNTAIFQQLQRLFMKAHMTQKGFTLNKNM
jgi:hypothetical protein